MLKWILGVAGGILVVAAIGTGIVLAVLPTEVERSDGIPESDLVPTDLTDEAESEPLSITITWANGIPPDVTAILQRSATGESGTWQDIATLTSESTEYTDNAIMAGQIYFYRVQASKPDGSEGTSPVVSTVAGS